MYAIKILGVIENAGPNQLKGFLVGHIAEAKGVDIAVAFVTQTGLSELLPALKEASTHGPVRLLTGLYQCFTEPQALTTLLKEQTKTKGRLSVRLSTDGHFHWKSYFLLGRKQVVAIIGSSNMTANGLSGSGELNAVLSVRRDSIAFRCLHRPFEEEWARAIPLGVAQITRYAKARPKMVRVLRPLHSIKSILGRRKIMVTEQDSPQYWRDRITGFLSDKTQGIIAETTNWERRGYMYYSSRDRHHRQGDSILLFDENEGYVSLVQVVRTTHTPIRTPDGRIFTAYRQIAKTRRRKIGKRLWNMLKNAGLIKRQDDVSSDRKLSANKFNQMRKVIGC